MKPRRLLILSSAASLLVAPSLHATTYTWTGNTDNTWANFANWNTTIPTASDIAQWDSGSTNNLGITLGVTPQSVAGLKVLSPSGAVTLSGSTLTLGTSGIDMSAATQNLTISSNLSTAAGNQVWNVASGQTLALNTGTFTRANNASLNIQGAGTVTTTMTGLTNAGSTNIIGAWATVGIGANTRYATRDVSNNLVAYTDGTSGTAIPSGTDGNKNYELTGTTTTAYGTFRDFNTVRYTGAGIIQTFNAGMNVRGGILNAGTGTFTATGSNFNIASGELVLHAANANIEMLNPLTGAGGKLTVIANGLNTVTLGGANTYTGVTTVNSGTLQFTKTQAFYSNTIDATNAAKLTVNSGSTAAFNMGAASGEFTEGNLSTLLAASNGSVGFKAGSTLGLDTTNAVGGSYTYVSAIANPNGNSIGLTKLGSGTLTLTNTNTYTGGTTVSAGTLQFAKNSAFYNNVIDATNAAKLTVNSGSTAAFNMGAANGEFTEGDLSTLFTASNGSVGFKAGSTLGLDTTNATGGRYTYVSAIANPNGNAIGLTKLGTGTLALTATNTYTGGTTVTGGTLSFANGALGTTGNISMNGGTLQWDGSNTQDVSSRIVMNAGKTATFDTNGNNVTFASGIGNSTNGSLVKSGNGTLTLSGTNNYSGQTTVSGGTLSITGTKSSAGNVSVNGTAATPAILNLQNSSALGTGTVSATNTNSGVQLQGDITLPGSVSFLISNSGGTVPYAIGNVSGNNTINGPIQMTVGGGSPVIQSDSGSLTLAGNITIAYGSDGNRTLTLQGASTGANTVSGVVSNLSGAGVASVTKNGTGTWTISGANTYTGATSVSGGKLTIASTGTINGTSGVSIGAGEFNYNSASALSQGVTFSGTGGTLSGSGTLTPAVTITSGNRQTSGSSVTATSATATVGKETFTTGITYNQGSIFEWNLNANDGVGTGTRGIDYDAVNAGALATSGTGAIFRVILNGTDNFDETFWNADRTWANIFTGLDGSTALDVASIFSGVEYYNSAGAVTNANTTGRGFSINGSTLTWSAVPEPTSALAGLLVGAGLLHRRRNGF